MLLHIVNQQACPCEPTVGRCEAVWSTAPMGKSITSLPTECGTDFGSMWGSWANAVLPLWGLMGESCGPYTIVLHRTSQKTHVGIMQATSCGAYSSFAHLGREVGILLVGLLTEKTCGANEGNLIRGPQQFCHFEPQCQSVGTPHLPLLDLPTQNPNKSPYGLAWIWLNHNHTWSTPLKVNF